MYLPSHISPLCQLPVPHGFRMVEYINATGNNNIIIPQFKYEPSGSYSVSYIFTITGKNVSANASLCGFSNYSLWWGYRPDYTLYPGSGSQSFLNVEAQYNFKLEIDGSTTKRSFKANSYSHEDNFVTKNEYHQWGLFYTLNGWGNDRPILGKFYGAQMYRNEKIVCNLIPCINEINDKQCVYDTVNNTVHEEYNVF